MNNFHFSVVLGNHFFIYKFFLLILTDQKHSVKFRGRKASQFFCHFVLDLEAIRVGAVSIPDLGLEVIRARVAQPDPHGPDLTHRMGRNPGLGSYFEII